MIERSRFSRNVLGFASAALISKIFGYIRDAMIVCTFGGGWITDSYYAAFRITNFFKRTLGEGSLNPSFIPAMEKEKNLGMENAQKLLNSVLTVALIISILISAAGIVFAAQIVKYTAYGISLDREQFRLTVILTVILMPHIIFVAASAIFSGTLNVSRKFFYPALIPSSFSLLIIIYLAAANSGWFGGFPETLKIKGLALTAALSGIAQTLFLMRFLAKEGYRLRLDISIDKSKLYAIMLPAVPATISIASEQLSMFINTIYASFLEPGSITAIYNSARIIQFPVALFGVSAATVSLPELSKNSALSREEEFKSMFNFSIKTTLIVVIPAALGLMILAEPVTRALFEHGKFSYSQSVLTSMILFYLSIGVVAYGVNKISATAYYATGDILTPFKIIILQIALQIVFALLLVDHMGAAGLGAATSISSIIACFIFLRKLRTRFCGIFEKNLGIFFLKTLLAAAVMAALTKTAWFYLFKTRIFLTAVVLIPCSIAVYFWLLKMFKIEERKNITDMFNPNSSVGIWEL
ncbi:MAG: murein biosynthesis integral membrane protein MurJ [Elusimicrobia bacterium]|nr:murein biosynthesis integral membrane protein MurJ [Elusimicrobiota bacterium]